MYVTAGATVCIMNKHNVKNIDLSNSNIKDFDLNSLKFFTNLTSLSLQLTSVTGDISSLSGLTKLTVLKCSNVKVSGKLNALENLTKLSTLYIDNTSITGDIKEFCNLLKNNGKISGTLEINANNSSATFEGVSKDVIAIFTASSISYSDK